MDDAKRLIRVFLLVLTVLAGLPVTSAAQTATAQLLGFTVTFQEPQYNPTLNETTFTYIVKGTSAADKDLSHFDIALCLPNHIVVKQGGNYKSSHPGRTEVGTDPHTGLTGIKFDVEVSKNGQQTFGFVLKGQWKIDDIEIGGKAGQNVEWGMVIAGPSCDPIACQVNYEVTQERADFRILRPGTYAALLTQIHLSGTEAVKLGFSEFGDAQYLEDPSAPAAQVEYSIGNTLADADAYGWYSAADFNGSEYYVDRGLVQAGVDITIWSRLTVETFNYSSDYRGAGKVSITPDCI